MFNKCDYVTTRRDFSLLKIKLVTHDCPENKRQQDCFKTVLLPVGRPEQIDNKLLKIHSFFILSEPERKSSVFSRFPL